MELPKVQLIPGHAPSSATFVIEQEDHTLGNSLRYSLMRNPSVQFCGYSMPHPSEQRINVRLQTRQGESAVEAFKAGCDTLVAITDVIAAAFEEAVARGPEPPIGGGGSSSAASGVGAGAGSSSSSSAAAAGAAAAGGRRSRQASNASAGDVDAAESSGAAAGDKAGKGGKSKGKR